MQIQESIAALYPSPTALVVDTPVTGNLPVKKSGSSKGCLWLGLIWFIAFAILTAILGSTIDDTGAISFILSIAIVGFIYYRRRKRGSKLQTG